MRSSTIKLGRRYLSKEDSMKRLPIAIAVTAVVSVAVCATSQAAPIAPISTAFTTNVDNIAYMYNGHAYPYRWHGHHYRYRRQEVTTIIDIIDTGAITTGNSDRFDDPVTCPGQSMSR